MLLISRALPWLVSVPSLSNTNCGCCDAHASAPGAKQQRVASAPCTAMAPGRGAWWSARPNESRTKFG
jgi:hypothetical protein